MWFYLIFTIWLMGAELPIEHRVDIRGPEALDICRIIQAGFDSLTTDPDIVRWSGVTECKAGGEEV